MKTSNKIILSGIIALLGACSNETATPDITGATTEPNSSPTANLTEEQVAVLSRALYSIVESPDVDPDSSLGGFNEYYYHPYSYKVNRTETFSYPSKDGRKTCDVVSFSSETITGRPGTLRAVSYDARKNMVESLYEKVIKEQDFTMSHIATLYINRVVEIDSIPVVLKTIGTGDMQRYWGYGVSCTDVLNQFKQSCNESNGLFKDFGDGCSQRGMGVVCASFAPEDISTEDLLDSYTEEFKNECLEDSIRYAPFDDENYVYEDLEMDSLYQDSIRHFYQLDSIWNRNNLDKSLNAYKWQFSVVANDSFGITQLTPPELEYYEYVIAYNTLPADEAADAFRQEGAYRLPDSLLAVFFPHVVTSPRMEEFKQEYEAFYMIVVKDNGVKGHMLNGFDANGIYVTDIVKSGNSCPEDTTVHYSAYLVPNTAEWDVVGRPVVKRTFVSEKWNCDNPESLDKIKPYGEWSLRFGELWVDPEMHIRIILSSWDLIEDEPFDDYPLL